MPSRPEEQDQGEPIPLIWQPCRETDVQGCDDVSEANQGYACV